MIVVVTTDTNSGKHAAYPMTLSAGLSANTFIEIFDRCHKAALTDSIWLVPGTFDINED